MFTYGLGNKNIIIIIIIIIIMIPAALSYCDNTTLVTLQPLATE